MNSQDLSAEMTRLVAALDQKQKELEAATTKWARAERDYRKAKRVAWVGLQSQKLTVPEKEAEVDGVTADDRYARDDAEGQKGNYTEAVRNLRAQISAVQTLAGVLKSEMDLAR